MCFVPPNLAQRLAPIGAQSVSVAASSSSRAGYFRIQDVVSVLPDSFSPSPLSLGIRQAPLHRPGQLGVGVEVRGPGPAYRHVFGLHSF